MWINQIITGLSKNCQPGFRSSRKINTKKLRMECSGLVLIRAEAEEKNDLQGHKILCPCKSFLNGGHHFCLPENSTRVFYAKLINVICVWQAQEIRKEIKRISTPLKSLLGNFSNHFTGKCP